MGFVGFIFAPFLLFGILAAAGFIISIIAVPILLAIILTIVGLALLKKHRKASKVLFILAAISICFLLTVIFVSLLAAMLLFRQAL